MWRKRMLAPVMLVLLAAPRTADAGWLDFIWEMSGPGLIGIGAGCEWSIQSREWRCDVPGRIFPGPVRSGARQQDAHWWVKTYTYYYFSTTKNGYDAGNVQGFGLDPVLMYAYKVRGNSIRITHGAGLSLQRLWSDDFVENITNVSYKFQPVTAEFQLPRSVRLKLAYNLRYYWDGFGSVAPDLTKVEPSEGTHGIVVSFTF